MKKNYLYIFATALVVGFSSCSDFLDRYPQEELSDGSFWKTPDDANKVVSDLYGYLSTWDQDNDINSDNATMGIKWAAGNVSKGIYDPADQGWSGDYANVRQCNLILSKIDEIPDYPEADKTKALGQVYFFRAYIYFNLIRSFGDVPYIDKPLDLKDMEGITRMPRAEVYEKIMADFDKAIAALPTEWGASDYGRVTKGAAMAMKARAALYYGNWDTAATEAKNVMDLGLYELYDKDNTGKYAELFWEKADGCDEFILVTQFNYPDKTHYLMGWECFPTKGWGGMNPTQSLVDAFEDSEGAPISKSKIYDPTDPFKNRDPRLEVDILHDGEEMYGVTIKVAPLASSGSTGINQHNDATETGYYGQKWLDPSLDPLSDGWNMGKDWVHIRYAEVLLTYAEAKNEVSGPDQSIYDAINAVRRRAGQPEISGLGQENMRKQIRNERRVELAFENKRYFDIMRWKIGDKSLTGPFYKMEITYQEPPEKVPTSVSTPLYNPRAIYFERIFDTQKNYLLPIPQHAINRNPKLVGHQNPGW